MIHVHAEVGKNVVENKKENCFYGADNAILRSLKRVLYFFAHCFGFAGDYIVCFHKKSFRKCVLDVDYQSEARLPFKRDVFINFGTAGQWSSAVLLIKILHGAGR